MKDVFKVLPTTQEENEYMIVIGKHLATTEKFPTREAAEEKINSVDWNLVAAMIYACKEADEYEKKIKRYRDWEIFLDRKSTRLNSSHEIPSRMPSSA